MITILHNPRCRKSREGLEIVRNSGLEFTIVPYLERPLTYDRLKELIKFLGITPIELVRTGETVWKDLYKGKKLSDEAIVQAMADHPKLIERPVVVVGDKAMIGRPPEKLHEFIQSAT